MSNTSFPSKLSKRKSLSILQPSNLNNLPCDNSNLKPIKERIISESTGLIKFSIKKPDGLENEGVATETISPPPADHQLPIYVPINEEHNKSKSATSQDDLLFSMASKQRQILELKEQLKVAEDQLSHLELQYRQTVQSANNVEPESTPALDLKTSIRKSTSLLNFNTANTDAFNKTPLGKSLNQFTNNLQTTSNGLFTRGKELWGTKIKKDIQLGQEMLAQIFEKREAEDTDELVDEKQFEYSVDFDLDHLNNLNVEKKLKGTLLDQLKEQEEEEGEDHPIDLNHILTSDDEDYGGDVVRV